MNTKNLGFIKNISSFFIITFVLSCVVKYLFDIRFIYRAIDTILTICFIASIVIWLVIMIKSSKKHRVLKISIISFVLALSILSFVTRALYGFFARDVVEIYSSPSGENTLVVLEGGFIDARYEAYPVKGYLFYQLQDNGYVSNHDDWGGSEITVTWESNQKAIVKIYSDFNPNEGSNINNEIVVQFWQP